MKNNMIKVSAAAVIIFAVLIVIHFSGGTINGSSVVWADVIQKVETSKGYIYRSRENNSSSNYAMWYMTPENYRTDFYEDGQVATSVYKNWETSIITYVNYTAKVFNTSTSRVTEQQDSENPRYLLQSILSSEHRELGQKTIDGVLCEGLETSDPSVLGSDVEGHEEQIISMQMQLWVDAKTHYPVLIEINGSVKVGGEILEADMIYDQFQWDVDLDTSLFELNIPPDYQDISPPAMN